MLFFNKENQVTRRCVFTLDNGFKFLATFHFQKTGEPMRLEQMEEEAVKRFNEQQPKMVHKVVKCHLMRN